LGSPYFKLVNVILEDLNWSTLTPQLQKLPTAFFERLTSLNIYFRVI